MKPQLKRSYNTTALFAASNADHIDFPLRYARAVENLKVLTPNILPPMTRQHPPYLPAAAEERARELQQHLLNPQVDILMSVSGGYNSVDLLEGLDYDLLESHWKPLVGYSDFSALQLGLYKKRGLISFYGPAAVPTFGEYPGVNAYSLGCLQQVLSAEGPISVKASAEVSLSNYFWDREDEKASVYAPNAGWKYLDSAHRGYTEGTLIGGNLDTMLSLAGTPYWPAQQETILFFEEAHTTPKKLVRSLNTLRMTGVLENVRGLLIGRSFCPSSGEEEQALIARILQEFAVSCGVPAVLEMDFGHSAPMLTLPVGIRASLDCSKQELRFLEAAVKLY